MKNVDLLTVLFASGIYLVMYIVWYSNFLFGKIYKKIIKKHHKKDFFHFFKIFILVFITCYIVELFEVLVGITTFWDGVFFGFLIWLGIVGTHSLFQVISFKRNIKLYLLDNLLYLLALMIVAGILAG